MMIQWKTFRMLVVWNEYMRVKMSTEGAKPLDE